MDLLLLLSLLLLLFGKTAPSDNELGQAFKLLMLVNTERQKHKLPPLVPLPSLNNAAWEKAVDMAKGNHTKSHQGNNDSWPNDRVREAGYRDSVAENIVDNLSSAQAAVNTWMTNRERREDRQNILNKKYMALRCFKWVT
ncbi:MAG: CAP domain-containing protein [Acidobacteria bacterium]|nr:CAP domain-containing protein [Acidobacteriota bacterium]